MEKITLGSLFDGIGVFPLAATLHGITPLWASEIEKAPISITRRHFPDMEHLGDITKLDGGKIPAVHVLTFGSPCQNLSQIGNRTGLAGEKCAGRKQVPPFRRALPAVHGDMRTFYSFDSVGKDTFQAIPDICLTAAGGTNEQHIHLDVTQAVVHDKGCRFLCFRLFQTCLSR